MFNLKYSPKFYAGIILIIANFILAKIATILLLMYYNKPAMVWIAIISYILTWFMLLIGVWWVGKEYAAAFNRYFTYKFYHESLKEGTKKMTAGMKEGGQKALHRGRNAVYRSQKVLQETREKGKRIHSEVKSRIKSRLARKKASLPEAAAKHKN